MNLVEQYVKKIRLIDNIEEQAKQKISEIEEMLNNSQIDATIPKIDTLFEIVVVLPFNYSHEQDLFRVRSSKKPTLNIDMQSLSYRSKAQSGIDIGRVNDYGEAILYAATTPITAMLEVRHNNDDCFNMLHFKKKPTAEWKVTTIGDISHYIDNGCFILNVQGIKEKMDSLLSQLTKEEINAIYLVDKFFYKIFSKFITTKEEYKLTNTIAKEYLSLKEVDGIVYKSVQHTPDPCTFNIALKTSSFDNNYDTIEIHSGKVENGVLQNQYKILGYGIGKEFNNNKILWCVDYRVIDLCEFKSEYSS